MIIGTTLLTTILGLAGTFLGLAILVQVIQECWKYLFSTKSSAYERALFAFIGPWARRLMKPGVLPDLQVDGPFQFWRRRPRGKLLPLDKPDLVAAMERTAPTWVRRALDALTVEADRPSVIPSPPSPALKALVNELSMAERGSPGFTTANEVSAFLREWNIAVTPGQGVSSVALPAMVDAAALLGDFRECFLPHVTQAERTFDQLQRNFDFTYRRRNTLITFCIALTLSLTANLPIGRLYHRADTMSPDEAVAMAEAMRTLSDSLAAPDPAHAARYDRIRERLLRALDNMSVGQPDPSSPSTADQGWLSRIGGALRDVWMRIRSGGPLYLVECLVTALLLSFGAPFWNDLAGTVLRLQRGPPKVPKSEAVG